MANITKNFHIIHMTDDLVALDAWYDDVFSVVRFMDQKYSESLQRHGSLVLIGDLCLEPMAPAFEVEGWERFPVGRFFSRFGQRWHSIAWYVEGRSDMEELFQTFADNDVRVLNGTGEGATQGPPQGAMFTHPTDCYTQLEFFVQPSPGGGASATRLADPRFEDSFDPGWWTTHHPLHLLKSGAATLAVRDAAEARDFYVGVLGGRLLHETEMPVTMTRSAFVSVGEDLVIELAEPLDADSPLAKDMDDNGQGLYAVSLNVADLGEAEKYLRSKGMDFAFGDDMTLFSDPSTSQGVVFGFTTREIPHDPRPSWA